MPTRSILARLEWCRQQGVRAPTGPERQGWRAEEEGLRDALLHSDHSNDYWNRAPRVFERYARGLEDGRVLIHLAVLDLVCGNQPPRGRRSDPLGSVETGKGATAMAHILVVDDDRPLRAFLRTVLEGDNHHVLEASNGRLGLELYRAQSPDVVITDLVMPEMDGLHLIYELTRSVVNVKVIAMTGGLDGDSRLAAAKLLGARQTLEKPFTADRLLSVVRDELAQ